MRTNADAVIIGGGIIGVAVAFYLAREKPGRVMLLDKSLLLGAGSTSRAAGGIRAQFSTEINIRVSMLAEELFRQFEEDTGYPALFDRVGYIFLLSESSHTKEFKTSVALQRSLGLEVDLLSTDDIRKLAPHIRLDDIQMASFCIDDGLGDPYEFLSGYEHAIRRLGVEIELETEVTGLVVNENRITDISTNKGVISTPLIINCAGAYARQISRMAGVELPVLPYPRQCVTTGELDWVSPSLPMIVDVGSGLYLHKESKGLLLGWADKTTETTFDLSVLPEYTDAILERALHRIPKLETAEIANQWTGLYETTPDHLAIIGWEQSVQGLFHVAGFSGHGFMHAPAAGLLAAQLISGKTPSIDISALSPQRFAKGALVHETNVI